MFSMKVWLVSLFVLLSFSVDASSGKFTKLSEVKDDSQFMAFVTKRIECQGSDSEKRNFDRGFILTSHIADYNQILQRRQSPSRRACSISDDKVPYKDNRLGVYLLVGLSATEGTLNEVDASYAKSLNIGAGFNVSSNLAIQAEYSLAGDFKDDLAMERSYSIAVLPRISMFGGFIAPYAILGGGKVELKDGVGGELQTSLQLNYGVGLDINFTKKYGVSLSHKVIANEKSSKLNLNQTNIQFKAYF